MTTLTLPNSGIPFLDSSGLVSREWRRFLFDLSQRAGGVTGASTEDLTLSQFEDAGIAENYHEFLAFRNAVGQMPPTVDAMPDVDLEPDVSALRGEIEELRRKVEALQQGLTA